MDVEAIRSRLGERIGTVSVLGACAVLASAVFLYLPSLDRGQGAHSQPAPSVLHSAAPPSPTSDVLPLQTYLTLTPQEAVAVNAATPFSAEPILPAPSFKVSFRSDVDTQRALQCLTQAVYYEAGFEPLQGRRAVAQVVLNRVRNVLFPKTVCGVVFQGSSLPTGCQFTFTCDGSLARPVNPQGWLQARAVAQAALAGFTERSVGFATHYHTMFVVPYWKPTLVKLTQIGAHIFYRWSGGVGTPRAFQFEYAGGEPAVPGAAPELTITPVAVSTIALSSDPLEKESGQRPAEAPPAPIVLASEIAPDAVSPTFAPVVPSAATALVKDSVHWPGAPAIGGPAYGSLPPRRIGN